MNSLDALRKMVASYPGGRSAIAARLGKSEEVLRKELSGTSAHHKIGLADAEQIAEMCHEIGSPEACALGTVFSFKAGMLMLPAIESGESLCLSRATANAVHETADVLLVVTKSKSDGNISDNDKKAVRREVAEAVTSLQSVLMALDAEHASDNAQRL